MPYFLTNSETKQFRHVSVIWWTYNSGDLQREIEKKTKERERERERESEKKKKKKKREREREREEREREREREKREEREERERERERVGWPRRCITPNQELTPNNYELYV